MINLREFGTHPFYYAGGSMKTDGLNSTLAWPLRTFCTRPTP
jgi:hypothetical protein